MLVVSIKYRCPYLDAVLMSYGATNVVPTQKDQLLPYRRGGPICKHINGLEEKFGHESRWGPKARRTVGRAIAQAVSLRLPAAAARVQTRVWSCGFL
jgi:hypothetical protein